jgi:hypothetical protein
MHHAAVDAARDCEGRSARIAFERDACFLRVLFIAKNYSFLGALLAERSAIVEWVPYRHGLSLTQRAKSNA